MLSSVWQAGDGDAESTLTEGWDASAQGWTFDPDDPVDAADLVWYREISPGCPGSCDFPGYESVDSWMGADWVRSTAGDAISALGMVPVEMPVSDLYLALERGTVALVWRRTPVVRPSQKVVRGPGDQHQC